MGKVVINELVLRELLESEHGPVGIEIERKAKIVVALARDEVAAVMHRNPRWADVVDYAMEDTTAVIGFKDSPPENRGPTFTYFGNKEIREGRFLEHALWIGHED